MSEHNGTAPVRRAAGIILPKPKLGCYHVGIEITGEGSAMRVSVWLLPPELEGARLVQCIGNAFTFQLSDGFKSEGCAGMICRPELDHHLGQMVQLADPP